MCFFGQRLFDDKVSPTVNQIQLNFKRIVFVLYLLTHTHTLSIFTANRYGVDIDMDDHFKCNIRSYHDHGKLNMACSSIILQSYATFCLVAVLRFKSKQLEELDMRIYILKCSHVLIYRTKVHFSTLDPVRAQCSSA